MRIFKAIFRTLFSINYYLQLILYDVYKTVTLYRLWMSF